MKKALLTLGVVSAVAVPAVTVGTVYGLKSKDGGSKGYSGPAFEFREVSSDHFVFGTEIKYGATVQESQILEYIKYKYGERATLSQSHWLASGHINSLKSGQYTYELDVLKDGHMTKKTFDFIVESHEDKTNPTIKANTATATLFDKVNDYEYTLKRHIKFNDKTSAADIITVLKSAYIFEDDVTDKSKLTIAEFWENNHDYSSLKPGTYKLLVVAKDEAKNTTKASVNVVVDGPDASVAPVPSLHNELFASKYAGMKVMEVFPKLSQADQLKISNISPQDAQIKYVEDHYINSFSYGLAKNIEKIDAYNYKVTMANMISDADFKELINIIESKQTSTNKLISFADADGKTADADITINGSWGSTGTPSFNSLGKYTYSIMAEDADGNSYPVTIELQMPNTNPMNWVGDVFTNIKTHLATEKANIIQVNIPDASILGDFFFKYQGGKWVSSLTNTVIDGWKMFKVNFTTATDQELEAAIKAHSTGSKWNDSKAWIHAHYQATADQWNVIMKKALKKLYIAKVTDLKNSNIRLLNVDLALWGTENNWKNMTGFLAKHASDVAVVHEIYKSEY